MGSNHLLPFAHDQSRPPNELALSTNYVATDPPPSSSVSRKREYPMSDNTSEFWPSSEASHYNFHTDDDVNPHHHRSGLKRLHQFTSDLDHDRLWELPASSPPMYDNEHDVTLMEDDDGVEDDDMDCSRDTIRLNNSLVTAQNVIQAAIDEGKSEVKLESLQLTQIPEEISDLKDLVILNDNDSLVPKVKIFLSHNRITSLSPRIFDVKNITVLTLRDNMLTEIPPAVCKLQNLVELSIGGNLLQDLPIELTRLKDLSILSLHPNPFREVPTGLEAENTNDDLEDLTETPNHYTLSLGDNKQITDTFSSISATASEPTPYFASIYLKSRNPHNHAQVASLTEQSLRVLADHIVLTTREKERLNLNPHFEKLINLSIAAKQSSRTCSTCRQVTVIGVGYAYEWWRTFRGNRNVVFKRNFCSWKCFDEWEATTTKESGLDDVDGKTE